MEKTIPLNSHPLYTNITGNIVTSYYFSR